MIPHVKNLSRALHLLLVVLAGFLALSAIPGGIALLIGFYAPPLEQLKGSVFTDFTIPGLSLLFLVGGSAVLATALLLRRHHYAHLAAAFAGMIVMSFEFVEVLAIGSPPGPAQVMQILYFAVGVALVSAALVAPTLDPVGHAQR